jgi:hypothetical protein
MKKAQIAFVTGGYSAEAEISYKSAITIENNLDKYKFDVYRIDITPSAWFHAAANGEKIPVDRSDFTLLIDGVKIHFDAVFIGIHGTPGEDGTLICWISPILPVMPLPQPSPSINAIRLQWLEQLDFMLPSRFIFSSTTISRSRYHNCNSPFLLNPTTVGPALA